MEQTGMTWRSKILEGLGVSSVTVPETKPGKVKQYVAALSIAAAAAIASFAPGVAHAADAPAAQPVELTQTVVHGNPDAPPPEASAGEDLVDFDEAAFEQDQRDSENPYLKEYKIPEREKDFIDRAHAKIKEFSAEGEKIMENPITDTVAYKVYSAVVSPLDTAVEYVTDNDSTSHKYASKAADAVNMAVKYTTAGPVTLLTDGVRGVEYGITKIGEHREEQDRKAQSAVDDARARMAKIYEEERNRIAAADAAKHDPSGALMNTASRTSGGLETSTDGMDKLFEKAPEKASKHEHDSGLSR